MAVKTKAVSIYKRVCGNCRQCKDGRCDLIGISVDNLRLACVNIGRGKNYIDNGYELEHAPTLNIDFGAIERMAARNKRFLELCKEARSQCKTGEDLRRSTLRIQAKLREEGYDEV